MPRRKMHSDSVRRVFRGDGATLLRERLKALAPPSPEGPLEPPEWRVGCVFYDMDQPVDNDAVAYCEYLIHDKGPTDLKRLESFIDTLASEDAWRLDAEYEIVFIQNVSAAARPTVRELAGLAAENGETTDEVAGPPDDFPF